MTGLSWELAGWIIAFQVLQAIVTGALIALLLWFGKRSSARRRQAGGDPA